MNRIFGFKVYVKTINGLSYKCVGDGFSVDALCSDGYTYIFGTFETNQPQNIGLEEEVYLRCIVEL